MNLPALGLRVFQLLFSAIVLGLSISLIKSQKYGSAPATTGYAAFTGGFGIVAALVGFASVFASALDGLIIWAVDGLASLFFLAGGIAAAVGLHGEHCDKGYAHQISLALNKLTNGGCKGKLGQSGYDCGFEGASKSATWSPQLLDRCRKWTADEAFMWMAFIICALVVAASFFLSGNRAGRNRTIV